MTQRILPIDTSHLRLQVLSPDDVRQIHQATLELIESIGVRFPSQRALDILADHGASVDRQKQVARIPGHVVEEAMRRAPTEYTLGARSAYSIIVFMNYKVHKPPHFHAVYQDQQVTIRDDGVGQPIRN